MSWASSQTVSGSSTSELTDLIWAFPEHFGNPSGPEKASVSRAITKAWTLLESIEDDDYVLEKTEDAVKECLKIGHEIKWDLAWTLLESTKDDDYIPEKTVEKVKDHLKIGPEITCELATSILPKGRPTDPWEGFRAEWREQHERCPGGHECAERSRKGAQKHVEEGAGKLASKLYMIRRK